jgi:hypothetical protein
MNQENKANPAPQICEYHPGKQCQGGARSSWGIFSSLKVVVVGFSMPWRVAFVKRTPVAVEQCLYLSSIEKRWDLASIPIQDAIGTDPIGHPLQREA